MTLLGEALAARMGGRSQEEFASEIGIDQTTLSRLLRGVKAPGRHVARAILRKYPDLRDAVADALMRDVAPAA